jgi:single-stranded-DNA-specific exonuclease
MAVAAAAPPAPVLVVAGEGWHPGVIGLVSSRLTERFKRPSCVISTEAGIGKGSGRSVPGVALGPAIIAARQAGLLLNGGGHDMAAGFTVEADRIDALREFLVDRFAGLVPDGGLAGSLTIDGALGPGGATPELLGWLEQVAPFGAGNAQPRFALPAVRVRSPALVGGDHVRCTLSAGTGRQLKAIAFRCRETPLGAALLNSDGAPLHIAGHLRANTWRGANGVQLFIDDAAPVSAE